MYDTTKNDEYLLIFGRLTSGTNEIYLLCLDLVKMKWIHGDNTVKTNIKDRNTQNVVILNNDDIHLLTGDSKHYCFSFSEVLNTNE